MDARMWYVIIALAGLVLFLWGSLGMAAHVVWLALGDLTGPPAEPVTPCAPEPAGEPTGALAGTTEAQERAWAEQWAARARG